MKALTAMGVIFFALMGASICSAETLKFPQAGLNAEVTWQVGPVVGQASSFQVQFTETLSGDVATVPVDFEVELLMPSMGHGSAPVQINEAVDKSGTLIPGLYDVSDVYFVMPGDWRVIFRLKSGEVQSFDLMVGK